MSVSLGYLLLVNAVLTLFVESEVSRLLLGTQFEQGIFVVRCSSGAYVLVQSFRPSVADDALVDHSALVGSKIPGTVPVSACAHVDG